MEKEINPRKEIPQNGTEPKKQDKTKLILAIVLAVIAVIYDISPIDFIPDVIPVVGWLDDVGITALSFINLFRQLKNKT